MREALRPTGGCNGSESHDGGRPDDEHRRPTGLLLELIDLPGLDLKDQNSTHLEANLGIKDNLNIIQNIKKHYVLVGRMVRVNMVKNVTLLMGKKIYLG